MHTSFSCLAGVLLLLASLLTVPAWAAGKPPKSASHVRLAFTIDDLPAVGPLAAGSSKAQVLDRIAETLAKHRVPAPVGFFNGSNMDADPATRAALARWLARGFVLGNHTYSHESASALASTALERDIERNHALIVELGQRDSHHSRYFRYPFLERGGVPEQRALHAYLARRHYRIADVSVDFQDWGFAATFVRCSARRDARALSALAESYLTYARAELLWAVETAQRVLGRPIPHVLLVHANQMTAELLDALLRDYERLGVRFISLDEALDDPAYARSQTPRHGDTTLIPALIRERRAHVSNNVPLPAALLDALCR